PSFMVSPSKQIWHCFGCGRGGDIFKFVMEIDRVDFREALESLADKAGVRLVKEDPKIQSEKNKLYDICEEAAKFFEGNFAKNAAARDYLAKRGLKEEIMEKFRLGFASADWDSLLKHLREIGYKNEEIEKAGLAIQSVKTPGRYFDRFRSRIMFPLFDGNGRVAGFSGRIFSAQGGGAQNPNEGKYVNTPNTRIYDKSRLLYGLNFAKNSLRKENKCVVVEGQMDLIMSHQAGVDFCVASSGTAFTPFQLNAVKRFCSDLLISFDMDEAGFNATNRSVDAALEIGFNARVITLFSGKDPADFIQEFGEAAWKEAVSGAKPIMEYYFEAAFKKFNPEILEEKKEISSFLLPLISRVQNEIEKSHWLAELARKLKTREEDLRLEMKKNKSEPLAREYGGDSAGEEIKNKPRGEILEERLLGFLLSNPEHYNLVCSSDGSGNAVCAEEDWDVIFSSGERMKIFKIFKETAANFNFNDFILKIAGKDFSSPEVDFPPADLAGKIKQYVFAAEQSRELMQVDPVYEIQNCVREILKERYRVLLAELSFSIDRAERAGQEGEIRVLFQKFHDYSQKLNKL
ncbi:MAG: DNA primase, partial [Patescibacteria group bacterium]